MKSDASNCVNLMDKHVLVVSQRFPPSQGGIQAAGAELAAMFATFGCRVSVATSIAESVSTSAWAVHVLAEQGFAAATGRLAQELRPDLVLVNGLGRGQLFPFALNCAPGVPVIYRAHGFNTAFQFHWSHPPFFGLPSFCRSFRDAFRNDRRISNLAQCVFLDDASGIFKNFDIALASRRHCLNVSFIPNAVPSIVCNKSNSFRLKYGLSQTKTMFLCVANYCDRKGQVDAAKAIIHHPELDAQFVFIGSERNKTASVVERLAKGDGRIIPLHGVPRSDVVNAINCCDAAFLFARQEQQPLFLIEAMSCGKPWFCTDVGSVSKMRGGIVLRRRNESCFMDAVKDLLNQALRISLGAECQDFWKSNYLPSVVHARWKRLLYDVFAGDVKCGY